MSLLSQDDVVMGTLSVRENLHFSAALRLPSHMTFKQRKERVERVIEELGLERCASTKVNVYRFKLHASTKHPSIMTHALFPICRLVQSSFVGCQVERRSVPTLVWS